MERTVYIYALVGGESDIRYIGQTVNLKRRFSEHKSFNCNEPERKIKWIKDLQAKGESLSMFILDECFSSEADFLEKYYILII